MAGHFVIFRHWWSRPSGYDFFQKYLERQGLIGVTRTFMGGGSALLGAISLLMLVSHVPPRGPLSQGLALVGGVCGLGGAALFAIRWPSKAQGVGFAFIAGVGVACASLSQSSADASIHACAGFAVLAGYIALFQTAPMMVANLMTAIGVAAVATSRLTHLVGVVAASCAFAVIVIANLAVPFGVQIVVPLLGIDVAQSDYDPLTGLLTRAAIYREARRTACVGSAAPPLLVAAMVDLDNFKTLNDRAGHQGGDEALTAVGHALRACGSPSALIGRVGGEEFLIVDRVQQSEPAVLAVSICDAIAAIPYPVTASVGTATRELAADRDDISMIADLVAAADRAMYDAKRNGGNQTCNATAT